jgi:hypothetical protein
MDAQVSRWPVTQQLSDFPDIGWTLVAYAIMLAGGVGFMVFADPLAFGIVGMAALLTFCLYDVRAKGILARKPREIHLRSDQFLRDTRGVRDTWIHYSEVTEIREFATHLEVRHLLESRTKSWILPISRMLAGDWNEFLECFEKDVRAVNPAVRSYDTLTGPPPTS